MFYDTKGFANDSFPIDFLNESTDFKTRHLEPLAVENGLARQPHPPKTAVFVYDLDRVGHRGSGFNRLFWPDSGKSYRRSSQDFAWCRFDVLNVTAVHT